MASALQPQASARCLSSLSSALATRPELEQWLGQGARDEHFVALNTASFVEGLLLEIEDGASLEVDELSSIDIEAVREYDEPDFSTPDPG